MSLLLQLKFHTLLRMPIQEFRDRNYREVRPNNDDVPDDEYYRGVEERQRLINAHF